MTLNDLENTMVVKLRNGGLYVVLTDVRIFCDKIIDKVTTIFAADNGYMNISSYAPDMTVKGSTNSEWDIMEVYKRVYTDVEEKRKEFPHTAPCGLRYLKDPKYLQSIWSRNAPEPIDDIVQDETIKELDEFGSKEVTFY